MIIGNSVRLSTWIDDLQRQILANIWTMLTDQPFDNMDAHKCDGMICFANLGDRGSSMRMNYSCR